MIDMIVKKKYIQLVLFVLLFSLGACNSDEMSDINDTTEVQEQMVFETKCATRVCCVYAGNRYPCR